MSPVIITLLVLLGVGALLAIWLVGIYNGLVIAGNRFKNAFAQIDVQLKRRYELIPNLVEAVKGYMGHERETLDAVIRARNSAMAAEQKVAANPSDPAAMRELNQAETQLGGILGRLFALSEAYPDLKANQNMLALQEELTSTENKIGSARQAFNDAAANYNIRLLDYLGHQDLQFHPDEYGTLGGGPSFEFEDGGTSLLCSADAVDPTFSVTDFRRTMRSRHRSKYRSEGGQSDAGVRW
jgi:LemA protein